MDFGMSNADSWLEEKIQSIQKSLDNHFKEYETISRKLNNPQVPEGKKEKLKYRQKKILNNVIPNLTTKLRRTIQTIS